MKTCTKCNLDKDESCFYKQKLGKDGLAAACKDCYRTVYVARTKTEKRKISRKRYDQSEKAKLARRKPNRLYSLCKKGAKERRLSFDLTYEQFCSIRSLPCTYCGSIVTTPGIDRIDSSKGYVLENCVSCCVDCNLMKKEFTVEEWCSQMTKILKYLRKI